MCTTTSANNKKKKQLCIAISCFFLLFYVFFMFFFNVQVLVKVFKQIRDSSNCMVSYINVKTHVSFVWFSNLSRTSYHYWWYLHDFIVMQIYIFPEVRLKNSRLLAKNIYFFFGQPPT